jgi:hypothetical protein
MKIGRKEALQRKNRLCGKFYSAITYLLDTTYRVPPIPAIAAITNARIRGDDIWSNGYFAWLADV